MRAALFVIVFLGGCQGILGIPDEGQVGCPEPCLYSVTGKVLRADSTNARTRSGVTVRLTSVSPPQMATSAADGSFAFADLPPGTPIELELTFAQADPDPGSLLVTRVLVSAAIDADLVVDLPVVEYRWLAKVAFECGLFPTLEEAIYADPGAHTGVNPYFIGRSTIMAELSNADGSPATIERGDVTVLVGTYANFFQNPADTTNPPPATVCFLEPDTMGSYKGVAADRTTMGRFLVLRARNMSGAGTGPAEVRVPSYPVGRVNLSSASIGFTRIKLVPGAEVVPPRPKSFERDVYPLFAQLSCTTCHKPGGIGYMLAPVRLGADGMMYPADWSGTPEYVYRALTQPSATGCDAGGKARVCAAAPSMSLIYTKPREEGGGNEDHQGIALPLTHPALATILSWVTDGAKP